MLFDRKAPRLTKEPVRITEEHDMFRRETSVAYYLAVPYSRFPNPLIPGYMFSL